ncbi:MAG TPA: MarR family transcriptional regulator [Burkholderiales bacterium]|nr:MarR family transcriptional regulator [Burkholderiales bacterium]
MAAIYDPQTYDLRNSVPYLMARTRAAMVAEVDTALAPFGMKAADYFVLLALANDISDTASGMCSFIDHDPGAMTRKIDSLEKKNLVRRVRDPADRRAFKLELTPEGKAVYPKVVAASVGVVNRFLAGFSKTEVRQMEDMLKRMLGNAGCVMAEAAKKEAKR